jgi:hypothetical protein
LADIGGGNGSLIAATLQRYPKVKGILFHLDHLITPTRESLIAFGVEDRCSLTEGNFFESLPCGADTYLSYVDAIDAAYAKRRHLPHTA